MKVVHVGNRYTIHDSSMQAYDTLPPGTYTLEFNKMTGFFLNLHTDLAVNEKIYGDRDKKVTKVLNAFGQFSRSLGVILSGDKGIGKSVFARMLCVEAIARGLPVIIVSRPYMGISSFFDQLDQQVLVLFDEFDKTFSKGVDDDEMSPQTELLSLFDGVSGGKKLYVITCNNTNSLNEYLLNRPGRFHYHFRFPYPSAVEIRTYLQDKIAPEYHGEIESVVNFSRYVQLNYDCLRAIAFELNTGLPFNEAIEDLNIVNIGRRFYIAYITFADGTVLDTPERIDFFGDCDSIRLPHDDSRYNCEIIFDAKDAESDPEADAISIRKFQVDYRKTGDHAEVVSVMVKPDTSDDLSYNVR